MAELISAPLIASCESQKKLAKAMINQKPQVEGMSKLVELLSSSIEPLDVSSTGDDSDSSKSYSSN